MKIATSALLLCLATSANGFVAPLGKTVAFSRSSMKKMATDPQEEVARLRAMAAKAREEADQLSKELGKAIPAAAITAKESMSAEDVAAKTAMIDFAGGDATSQSTMLDELTGSGDFALWKSATKDQNLRTFPVSQKFLESRTGGKVNGETLGIAGEGEVTLEDFKYATLGVTAVCSVVGVAALALLPENVGASVCYAAALIPILFLGVGSTTPALIANAIAAVRSTSDDKEMLLDRICRHESAHFLCGYLCGLPVKDYALMESGVPCVEFHQSSSGDATSKEFSQEEVAALSVVAMSGSVGEILDFGDAKGGENDLIELEGVFRRSKEFIGAQQQQDLTRWGALTAFQLLTQNKDKYDALVEAFKNKKSVSECVAVLESR
mmetsp:Transcript_31863/g.52534  ORF Transcript_31863/g.52534 Transcript_31863/m.52534 type:complete len:381 (-) Transcript_31863:71-1213(-)